MVYFVLTPRCFAYRHAATTFYQLQRGFGAGGNMRESRIFRQFYLVLSLFYSLQRGSNGFIAEKTLLILYQGSKGVHYFPGGGGVKLFPGGGGSNASFFRIVSEYDQEIPQSQTADNPVAPRGRAAQPSQDTRKTN